MKKTRNRYCNFLSHSV